MKNIILGFLLCFAWFQSQGQTADITFGCIPLEVNFTGPTQSNYYWDFGDTASSELQNPKHVYTTAGIYTATLFDGVNGTNIGEITITVYADPEIIIEATPESGCSPLQVQFTPSIVIDPAITILGYLWSFGDGNSSTDMSPSHTYTGAGTYDVSLAITTNLTECNKTVISQELIVANGAQGNFFTTNQSGCEVPATLSFTNLSDNNPDYDFFWDFGNGDEFMGFSPGTYTYNTAGQYAISLTIIDEAGCESTIIRNITVGPTPFDLTEITEFCWDQGVFFENNTDAVTFLWNFGQDAEPQTSSNKEQDVMYQDPGLKTVTLQITDSRGCQRDTSFTVDAQIVDATFTYTPDPLPCNQPLNMVFTAVNQTYSIYDWSISDDNVPILNFEQSWPPRDSLHLHWEDSLTVHLLVINDIGCTVGYEQQIRQRKPDAYFLVDKSKGCAPLTINFTDDTRSIEEVTSYRYIYGNGEEDTFTTNDSHSFTYEEPGEYYVRLIIENELGCIDTSAGVWIEVGEQIPSEYEIDKIEICLGESINLDMLNLDDRIDAWHFSTDENRLSHCWDGTSASHTFVNEPGTFPLQVTTEYNGCYWTETAQDAITVNGAKANLSYMTSCETPFDVMFESKSKNASSVSWELETPDQYDLESFTHTFTNKGIQHVILTAEDNTSDCPISIDSALIHIVLPEARFDLPEFVCDNVEYILDASSSIDVNETCSKGYLWNLPNNRPRELGRSNVEAYFITPGDQEVTLIVEDINGCTDTLTQQTRSFSMQPNFLMDMERICLPATVNFTDISMTDTSIVNWDWSFGETDSLTSFTFDENTSLPLGIFLTLTDAIGCVDQQSKFIQVYEPFTEISFDNGPNICVGEEINFSADDFTEEGSFLNFNWDFGPFGTSTNQTENIVFDENGTFDIVLSFEEEGSGCVGDTTVSIQVVQVPVAIFSSPVDDEAEICHPAIIEFTNESSWEGPVIHRWDFGNGSFSVDQDPFIAYSKGTYEVELIVQSQYGCADTTSKVYTLVGPEGELLMDKNVICTGESISFELINQVDVNSFSWVFGDGTTEENINPITHTFDFNPPGGQTKVDLILKSAENGCEFIITEPITIIELMADFEFIDSSQCEGLAYFQNTSTGDFSNIQWDFGNGETSNQTDPTVVYDELGMYEVSLTVSDAQGVCNNTITREVNIEEVEEYIFFPNVFTPNGDGENDFFNVVVKPQYEEFVSIRTFRVYNRWGNLLYDNENPAIGWDGNQNATPSPAEVYAFFIEVEVTDCDSKIKKGNVTIIR